MLDKQVCFLLQETRLPSGCLFYIAATVISLGSIREEKIVFSPEMKSEASKLFFFFFLTQLKEAAESASFTSACQIDPMGPAPLSEKRRKADCGRSIST